MPFPADDAVDFTIVIIALIGSGDPHLLITIEESNDDVNWRVAFEVELMDPVVGALSGPLFGLSAKRYRVRWGFGDATGMNFVTCVLAANVETHHD